MNIIKIHGSRYLTDGQKVVRKQYYMTDANSTEILDEDKSFGQYLQKYLQAPKIKKFGAGYRLSIEMSEHNKQSAFTLVSGKSTNTVTPLYHVGAGGLCGYFVGNLKHDTANTVMLVHATESGIDVIVFNEFAFNKAKELCYDWINAGGDCNYFFNDKDWLQLAKKKTI